MRIGWSHAHGERVRADAGWSRLHRALLRRGAEIVPCDAPSDDLRVAVLAAPSERLGPDAVRAWRRWADRGGRLLVLGLAGGDGAELTSDAGLTIPGMSLAPWHVTGTLDGLPGDGCVALSGSAFILRNSASLLPPDHERAGRLWPRGRGWFRFGRSHDLLEAWPLPADAQVSAADGVDVQVGGWVWLHIGLGDGTLLGLADAATLSDDALDSPDHMRMMSHVLEAWLPAPEAGVCARRMAETPAEMSDDLEAGQLVRTLAREGIALGEPGDEGAPLVARAPAFRALGDAGLARWDGRRIALTELGSERIDVVFAVFDARAAHRRRDLLEG